MPHGPVGLFARSLPAMHPLCSSLGNYLSTHVGPAVLALSDRGCSLGRLRRGRLRRGRRHSIPGQRRRIGRRLPVPLFWLWRRRDATGGRVTLDPTGAPDRAAVGGARRHHVRGVVVLALRRPKGGARAGGDGEVPLLCRVLERRRGLRGGRLPRGRGQGLPHLADQRDALPWREGFGGDGGTAQGHRPGADEQTAMRPKKAPAWADLLPGHMVCVGCWMGAEGREK
mmetsp:Transcript_28700/g.92673  ORF Transcript_28700/g.92673 Transcript_28700/m.92673 type:complete len:227 (+) Transcript_28700:495-1175(+)